MAINETIIMCCCLLLAIAGAKAQDSPMPVKQRAQFKSILQGGLLAGKTESSYGIQTINGIQWKTFSAGVGVGIDGYVFRTIPLFIDVQADILNKKNTPFVFADAGPQFCWLQDGQKKISFFDPTYKAGFYFNAGAGYKVHIQKRNSIIFSAAFSMKKVNETTEPYCDFAACPEQKPTVNEYTFRRLSVMLGWIF